MIRLFVELFGAESAKLPKGEGDHTFPTDTTPADVVAWLTLADGEQFVVLIDGQPVQANERAAPILKDGQRIAVFPPMEGG